MTPTTPATPASPSPWLTAILAELDALEGGALKRLAALAASPPTSPEELWPALAAIEKRFQFPVETEIINPTDRAIMRGETVAQGVRGQITGTFAGLVGNLVKLLGDAAQHRR